MVEIKAVIASYSGEAYMAIRSFLSSDILGLIARVATAPTAVAEVDASVRDELVAMHVLCEEGNRVRLDTSVFLENDIRMINAAVSQWGAELADQVSEAATEMRREHPIVTNYIVGIMGIGQSLGHALWEAGVAVDWRNYEGKYARSKVDFDEICEAQEALGPDPQSKNVLRGARYTAVLVGPGGPSYPVRGPEGAGGYSQHVNAFLTDAYAMLVAGQLEDEELRAAAEAVGLFRDGKPDTCVLTRDNIGPYLPVMQRVGAISQAFFSSRLDAIRGLLQSTSCGRQGVPVENMMLNLWRYMRRGIARELYASGFFQDRGPETGVITLFYENDVEALQELLD